MNRIEFIEIHEFFGRASRREIPRALVALTPVPESAGSPLSSYPATCDLRPTCAWQSGLSGDAARPVDLVSGHRPS